MQYLMKKVPDAISDHSLHQARMNNKMSSSSRSTRTRKNIKASTGDVSFAAKGVDLEGDDDDDYNMEEDANMLVEDEDHDAQFDEITEKMTMSSGPEDEEEERKRKKKKKKKRKR